ncbi:hypothetical protein [Actinomadura sp. NPDC000600]|uniref:hypothetical protein n=1 Tax=Actinomadura sp. NPDC000600 TaxID=3154262 RepID=UPI00339B4ED1
MGAHRERPEEVYAATPEGLRKSSGEQEPVVDGGERGGLATGKSTATFPGGIARLDLDLDLSVRGHADELPVVHPVLYDAR